ncbi:MAG: YbaN family protein [Halioglobus sp.]
MRRKLYKPLGFAFLLLGGLGIVLPILPSTPFVLLAAWFFARSSEKWHQRLLDSEMFGAMIRNWEANRCISLRTKIVALCAMLVAGSASVTLAIEDTRLKLFALAMIAIGTITVLMIKTCSGDCEAKEAMIDQQNLPD